MKADELRLRRKRIGLSSAALAARANVSRWRLIEFELGNLALRPDELARINDAMRRASDAKIAELGRLTRLPKEAA